MLNWFSTSAAKSFGRQLAALMVAELEGRNLQSLDSKSHKRAQKAMDKAARQVQEFRARSRPNVLQKARLANTFLWTLKDAGWPESYANQMTDWLTMRL